MREKWSAAPRRIAAFDALRGFALVNMAVYHGVYDWVYVFGRPAAWFTQTGNAHIWQQFICWTFILLAGAVFPYGKHAVRRGAVTFGCGFLLTAVTMLVMPSEQILFGVLHLIGAAVLLSALLRRFLDRAPALPGAIASCVLFCSCEASRWDIWALASCSCLSCRASCTACRFCFRLACPA
ncbi:MAG: heparan-alpha-glucosaminide N-acetyltransferase domain-containing protein, partial [Ruthenibacterium lactatiformans]